jgi:glucose-6-phosphate isomerase
MFSQMSSNRFGPKFEPLRFVPPAAISRADWDDRLETARNELLAQAAGPEPLSLGAELIHRPERLLSEYKTARRKSRLGRILTAAARLREAVDRVVVVGGGGFDLAARALFGACCHPYHNELGRGDRGGRPRIYFAGASCDNDSFDNDATQGLLDLLVHRRSARGIDERWGLIVIGDENDAAATLAVVQTLVDALQTSCGDDPAKVAELVLPVTSPRGRLFELAQSLGCPDIFADLDGAGGRFSVFTAAGLLPASVMGLDLFQLLRGAAAMNERFRTAPPGDNPVLDYVAAFHANSNRCGAAKRVLATRDKALDAVRAWHDLFQPLHAPDDKLVTNLVVDQPRRDRLPAYIEMTAAPTAASHAHSAEGSATADIHLPHLDESALGQFFQMMTLAASLEERVGTTLSDRARL